MKAKLAKILNSGCKAAVNLCLAYGVFMILGHHSFILFGEPEFPEI
ncbi:MAG: hypothetical protein ACI4AA_07880 [Lachnospiraceae bacterium]